MGSQRVEAAGFRDAELSKALRRHAGERDAILGLLKASLAADSRIRAAWLWGSFMRGEADDLSDLDIWMLVDDGMVGEMAAGIESYCRSASDVVCGGENAHNAPTGGGYFSALAAGSHGLHHMDIYWQGVSAGELPDAPMMFNRIGEAAPPVTASHVGKPGEPEIVWFTDRLSIVWLMLSVAAKYLARDPDFDMALLQYPKPSFDDLVDALDLRAEVGEGDWSATDSPMAKVELLRRVARGAESIERACRARGMVIAPDALPALFRYFQLVELVLRERAA